MEEKTELMYVKNEYMCIIGPIEEFCMYSGKRLVEKATFAKCAKYTFTQIGENKVEVLSEISFGDGDPWFTIDWMSKAQASFLRDFKTGERKMEKYITVDESIKAHDRLKDMPEEFKTPEICLEVVKYAGTALEFVPEELKTPEVCLAAVKDTGYALQFVPEKLKTPEICLAAVGRNGGYPLQFVPEEFKTLEMCLKAVKAHFIDYFKYIPSDIQLLCKRKMEKLILNEKSTKLSEEAIKVYDSFKDMPDELKTSEVCLETVKAVGYALEFVPEEFKTLEMCLAAVEGSGGYPLLFVPEEFKTPEMCLKAVKSEFSSYLKYIPSDVQLVCQRKIFEKFVD